MSTRIKIRHQGIALEITKEKDTRFVIPDYATGKRVRHVRTTEAEAREKAKEICEAMASGNKDLLGLSPFESEIYAAMHALPVGVRLGRAADIIADCCRIVEPDEILAACRFWKDHRPDKKFTPKPADAAVDEYMDHQKHLSERRQRVLQSYFSSFLRKFGRKSLHEITTAEVKDLIFGHVTWAAAKTRNEVLGAIGLLFADAQSRGYVAKGHNPAAEIRRERLKNTDAAIYLPEQVRAILHGVEEDLAPFLAVWFFAGCRKESIARMPWTTLRQALKTGSIKITGDIDQKTGARSIPLEPNLRQWILHHLNRHPDVDGYVLPKSLSENRKIDNVTRKIANRTNLIWTANGPRHSYVTMRLARGDDVQSIAKHAGNSLSQIQKHYWNRDEGITAETATEYFSILPPSAPANIVPMSIPAAG